MINVSTHDGLSVCTYFRGWRVILRISVPWHTYILTLIRAFGSNPVVTFCIPALLETVHPKTRFILFLL